MPRSDLLICHEGQGVSNLYVNVDAAPVHCDCVLSDCLIALVPDEAGLDQERQHHASAQQSDRHFPAVWRLAGPGAAHVQPVEGITGEYPGREGDQQLESLYKSLSERALHARILA